MVLTYFYTELFFIAILGFISHFRFEKVLANSRESNNAQSITNKIRYFQELNLMLAIVVLDCAVSFIILSADGLTGRKYLNAHKFTADLLICNSKEFRSTNSFLRLYTYIYLLTSQCHDSARVVYRHSYFPSQAYRTGWRIKPATTCARLFAISKTIGWILRNNGRNGRSTVAGIKRLSALHRVCHYRSNFEPLLERKCADHGPVAATSCR